MNFKEIARKMKILWFTPKQVAELLQCSKEHIYDLAKSRKISYIKDGKNIRFKPEDLDEYTKLSYVRRKHAFVQKEW